MERVWGVAAVLDGLSPHLRDVDDEIGQRVVELCGRLAGGNDADSSCSTGVTSPHRGAQTSAARQALRDLLQHPTVAIWIAEHRV